MKNPFKKLKSPFKRKARDSHLSIDTDKIDYSEVLLLWPDGSWGSDLRSQSMWKDMDRCVQSLLLDCWANEEFLAAERSAGRRLNPGMFGSGVTSVPKGWTPSEALLKQLFARNNWEVPLMHYIVGELQHRRKTRA